MSIPKDIKFMLIIFSALSIIPNVNRAQEILVLGIAQDAGHPQADCQKSCCESAFANPSQRHLVASIAISDGESFWIVDATPDFTEQLNMAQAIFKEQRFGGILLTHAHVGHYTGLMYLGREAMGATEIPVYTMPRMHDFLRTNGPWSQLVELGNIKLIEIGDGSSFKLSNSITIEPLLVPHRDEFSETAGFAISSSTKKLLYIPDIDKWDRWHMDLEALVSEFDHLLIDGTFYDGEELPGRNIEEIPHPFVIETASLLERQNMELKQRIKFIHLNHTNPLLDENSKAYSEIKRLGYSVARRGEIITID